MELVSFSLLGAAVVGLGCSATVLLARWIPLPIAQLAAQHGRFVGLSEQRAEAPAPYRMHVQPEAMNVVGTSN
ncbi:hypothetical protein [Paraburkholderia dilworthii]|uniref:hypothetical protein n=1 Tax=Paraburkholderia dilworthii TaxID=948106 RepID=UPI0004042488|nr:hypothetical protein [Paraburkholderia dilworthii]